MYESKMNSFMDELTDRLLRELGEGYAIDKTTVIKNNGVVYHGLVVKKEQCNVAPTIYVDSLYTDFLNERSINDIVQEIIAAYKMHNNKINIAQINSKDWLVYENVFQDIFIKVVNFKNNEQMLKQHPHIRFLDLAITFHIFVEAIDGVQGSIRVNNDLMERWNISVEELYNTARINTRRLYPFKVRHIKEVVSDMLDGEYYENNYEYSMTNDEKCDIVEEDEAKPDMYVLTNEIGVNGSAALIYDDYLAELSRKYGERLVLLPSSIHELICITGTDETDYSYLKALVREVNLTQVAPEEILSDNIYIYDNTTRCVECY